MVKLDYDAINNGFPTPSGAFVVNVDPRKPPGDPKGFRDYIPQTPSPRTRAKEPDAVYKAPIARFSGVDYLPNSDASARLDRDREAIKELAKTIWEGEKRKRDDFKAAKETLDKASEEQKRNPSGAVERAIKVLSRKPPLTKEEVIEKATKQFYCSAG